MAQSKAKSPNKQFAAQKKKGRSQAAGGWTRYIRRKAPATGRNIRFSKPAD